MPRLFVAVDVPPGNAAVFEQIRTDALDARWTPPDHIHLTVRFLGNVDDATTSKVATSLRAIVLPSFRITDVGMDVFPSRRRPQVLVLRIKQHSVLDELHGAVNRKVTALGLAEDRKPFRPHITFARLKRSRPRDVRRYVQSHAEFRVGPFAVREFRLYRSELDPGGAVHTAIESYPLRPFKSG